MPSAVTRLLLGVMKASRRGTSNYDTRVLAIPDVLGYWKSNETSGTQITDSSVSTRHGAYVNSPTLASVSGPIAGLGSAPLYNGTNQSANLFTTSLRDAWNATQGTVAGWFKVADVSIWTNGLNKMFLGFGADANNRVFFWKNSTNNRLSIGWVGNSTTVQRDITFSSSAWFHVAFTWNDTVGKVYLNGVQQGTDLTLTAWAVTTLAGYSVASFWNAGAFWINAYAAQQYANSRALALSEIAVLANL